MCGRFTLTVPERFFSRIFVFKNLPPLKPEFNIAPGRDILSVHLDKDSGETCLTSMRWGLVPSWAKDPAIGNKLINARSETVREKPAFRDSFQKRRCLIPADGFYEWKANGKHRQAFHIHMKDRSCFAFAGLWTSWQHETTRLDSCTILTTRPNDLMASIHHRMPVIITEADYDTWLFSKDETTLSSLLTPYPHDAMKAEKVSDFVNSISNQGEKCLQNAPPGLEQGDLFY